MERKRNLIYKLCMSLIIAFFICAMYFNNQSVLDRITETRRNSAAVDLADAGSHGQAGGQTVGQAGDQTGKPANKFNFTLFDANGEGKEFSDYYGNIVFMVFWTSRTPAYGQLMAALTDELTNAANTGDYGYDIKLISVFVTEGGREADFYGTGADMRRDYISEYVDKGATLAGLFLIDEYPTTYIFYPSGELCDYGLGMMDASRIERLIRRAAGGSRPSRGDGSGI